MKNGIRRLLMAVLTLTLVFAVTAQAGAEINWTNTNPEIVGHYRLRVPEDWSAYNTGDGNFTRYHQAADGNITLLMAQQLDGYSQLIPPEMYIQNYLSKAGVFTADRNGVEKLELQGMEGAFAVGRNAQGEDPGCIILVTDGDCALLSYFQGSVTREDAQAYARGISLASEPENGTAASADTAEAQITGTWRSNILSHYTLCFYEDGMMVEDMDGDTSKAIWYEENGGWYLYYPIEKETYQILLKDSGTMVLKDLATQVDYTFIRE